MAEVPGLIIGAVALASLFSTCIDLFDRFELGRNFIADYQLASTKLSLLKTRLWHWGRALNIEVPGSECSSLREHWYEEKDIVGRSLLGIERLLSDVSLLEEKYKMSPKPVSRLRYCAVQSRSSLSRSSSDSTTAPLSAATFFRKRTTWAVHDKGKFDALIQDLSFFIENLENVTLRLRSLGIGYEYNLPDNPQQLTLLSREASTDSHTTEGDMSTPAPRSLAPSPRPAVSIQKDQSDQNKQKAVRTTITGKSAMTAPEKGLHISGKQENHDVSMAVVGSIGEVANANCAINVDQNNRDAAKGLEGSMSETSFKTLMDGHNIAVDKYFARKGQNGEKKQEGNESTSRRAISGGSDASQSSSSSAS